MSEYDSSDFQEHKEGERELNRQPQSSSQGNDIHPGSLIGIIVAIVVIVLMIVFIDYLGPILIVGGAAFLLARWLLG